MARRSTEMITLRANRPLYTLRVAACDDGHERFGREDCE